MRSLSDDEQSIVWAAAAPLLPPDRRAFIDAVGRRITEVSSEARGPGLISRVCRELQRSYFVPPVIGNAPRQPNRRW